ncbi:putative geranylgeranyl-diphosphate geranylgeranyltransferase (AL-2) protein [Rutstroemia sp. NJR-2017a BBW]|nr:putative geranylgeranyl-diphosphate geranylgeranyltransferase (AL-2) protein [Rutstroemia sp. NJR-2017a BBW]
MGFDYALVHLKFTIPPAIALTYVCRPLLHRIDVYKILFLIAIAVVSTIPWDSYLIRRKIWTYPPHVIVGPKLFSIPAEELFFFVIQTYNTTLLYLLLSRPVFHSAYLVGRKDRHARIPMSTARNIGQLVLGALITAGGFMIWQNGKGTYLGLILAWAGPFALLLWTLSYQFLIGLPYASTLVPIAVPTVYLWFVDTLALRRGTWTIEGGTKLGIHLWDGLEIEEAIFFLATNILIVFGLVAFDHAMAILLTFPDLFPDVPSLPSPAMLVRALLTDTSKYDLERIAGVRQAVVRLQKKSRSFYLASAVFNGRLRIDLILLYSFCRVADDLVDDASTISEAQAWVTKLTHYLDLRYTSNIPGKVTNHLVSDAYIRENFPSSTQAALRLLPAHILSPKPLYELLEGFKTDLEFHPKKSSGTAKRFPIESEDDLSLYSTRVAGTVAEMCLELIFHHSSYTVPAAKRHHLIQAGARMGIALQYINIARDVMKDAKIGRVYLPTCWLEDEDIKPQQVIENPSSPSIDRLRGRLLEKAFGIYREARPAIEQIPVDTRAPMRVAVESYVEIGRVMKERGYQVSRGQKATVPKSRRIWVAWKALSRG